MRFKKLFDRKKQARRDSRANAFVLESLEPRLLLSATPMTAAVVTTDHLDYAPGETAVITTSNQAGEGPQFAAGEMVSFQVSRTDGMADYTGSTVDVGPMGNEAWYVTDGVGGFTVHRGSDVSGDGVADWIAPDNDLTVNSSISTTWFVEEQYRNSSLLVTAAGQESGAVATQAFTDEAINTTTVLTSNVASSTYGDVVTFTATVTAAIGTDAPIGTVVFWDGSTIMGTATVPDSTGVGTATWSIPSYQYLIEGPHPNLHAVFTPTDPAIFNDSTSASITHTVAAKQITASLTVANKAYDGTTAATGVIVTLNGVLAPDDVAVAFSSVTFSDANVGGNKTVTLTGATLIGTERLNYSLAVTTLTTTADITKATVTITGNGLNGSGYYGTYDGQAHVATATVTGVGGENLGQLVSGTTHTNAGVYSDTVTYTDATGNYNDASKVVKSYILKATVTLTGSGLNGSGYYGTYDGQAHAATATVTGVGGVVLGQVTSGTTHTNAGVYNDTVTFLGDANYRAASKLVKSYILKASVTITGNGLNGSGYFGTYDGLAHAATATVTGVGGVVLGQVTSSTTNTNVGIYNNTVTFLGDANYKAGSKVLKSYIF